MKKIIIAAIMSAGIFTQPAFAKLQTFSFSGVVESMQASYWEISEWGYHLVHYQVNNGASWGGPGIVVGDHFSGTVSFNDDPVHVKEGASFSLSFDGSPEAHFGAGEAQANISNYLVDGVIVPHIGIAGESEQSNGLSTGIGGLRVKPDGRVGFDMSEVVAGASWRSVEGNGGYNSFIGRIDSLINISPVPEPATYGMLLAGLGLLGVAARRNGRQQRK